MRHYDTSKTLLRKGSKLVRRAESEVCKAAAIIADAAVMLLKTSEKK